MNNSSFDTNQNDDTEKESIYIDLDSGFDIINLDDEPLYQDSINIDIDEDILFENIEELVNSKSISDETSENLDTDNSQVESFTIDLDLDEAEQISQQNKQLPEHTIDQEVDQTAHSESVDTNETSLSTNNTNSQVSKENINTSITHENKELSSVKKNSTNLVSENLSVESAKQTEESESLKNQEKSGWFTRMKSGLSKSRKNLADGMMNILVGGKEIDDELLEEVEDQLLVADIGVDATNRIITNLTEQTDRGDLIYSHSLYKALQQELIDILEPKVQYLSIDTSKKPFVILMVGVNGVGKTTTIGKLAKRLQGEGKSVMLAAGDTFRAAATEQLQVWGERNNIPVVAQGHGSDSASVIFDAMQSAKAKNIDVLIADTAGRLQNKSHLMTELEKVVRVMQKSDPTAPHETMIVLDAGTGQNALNQVDIFNQAVNLTGITVTKLDGTAKGGVVFNIANTTDVPIRYIGVGEAIDDLREFAPKDFVKALFDSDSD